VAADGEDHTTAALVLGVLGVLAATVICILDAAT
jgi:hypothetical protein